jgi:Tetratricopeptide repeat
LSSRSFSSIVSNVVEWLAKLSQVRLDVGAIIVIFACWLYHRYGFHFIILATWMIGVATSGFRLYKLRAPAAQQFKRSDLLITLALYLVALPCFVWSIYTVPYQVNADEIAVLKSEILWYSEGICDVFGLSHYFGFTFCHFLIEGWLANLLGGIDLYHVRLLHGLTGAAIVASAYVFYRVLGLPWLLAVGGSLFICSNHSLIALSRMANITNFPLFMELCALSVLFEGLKRRCLFTTYLGGVLTGLGFYVYYPARIVAPMWLVFNFLLFLHRRSEFSGRTLVRLIAVFAFGIVMTIGPLAMAHERQRQQVIDSIAFQKHQCLLYPEGRNLNKYWTGEKTIAGAILHNIRDGLTVFNNNVVDEGFQYENPGHGFVDPLSGVLIWVGFATVLLFMRTEPASLLMLSGFLLQMFAFSFLITKAPNYTRLLVILPFAGYFIAQALGAVSSIVARQLENRRKGIARLAQPVLVLSASLAIAVWNFNIFQAFNVIGQTHGDDIGGTVRYVEARRTQPAHLFITAASPQYPYYRWDGPDTWTYRVESFLGPEQECMAFAPQDLTTVPIEPPFTIFMNKALWAAKQAELTKKYPHLVVHPIFDLRGALAVENTDITPNSLRNHAAIRQARIDLAGINEALADQDFEKARKLCLAILKSPAALTNGSKFKSEVLLNLGRIYGCTGKYKEAEPVVLEATKIQESISEGNEKDCELGQYFDTLANTYVGEEKWAQAEAVFRKSTQIWEAYLLDDLADDAPQLSNGFRSLAITCQKQGKFSEARQFFQKAIALCCSNQSKLKERAEIVDELASCEKESRAAAETVPQQGRVIR